MTRIRPSSDGGAEKTTTKLNASQGQVVRASCASCQNPTNHKVVSSVDVKDDYGNGEIISWTTFQIIQCLGCESYSFRKNYKNTEVVEEAFDGSIELAENIEVYPPRATGRPLLRNARDLPPRVGKIYQETHRALCSEMPILATIGIRALVEAVCKEQNAQGRRLEDQIGDLVTQGVLTRREAEVLRRLQVMGNKAAHEVKRHSIEKLGLALDIAEHLLQGVYLFPEEAERLR